MIGLDLDGTLLNDKKELTSHTREILTRAIDQGVTVLVATGRPVTGIPEVLRNFPGMRYALTSNGGRILDLQEDKVLYANMLSYEMGAAILKIFGDYDTFKEIYFDGRGFVQADELLKVGEYLRNPAMADYIRTTRKGITSLWEKMEEMNGHEMDKIHALFKSRLAVSAVKYLFLRLYLIKSFRKLRLIISEVYHLFVASCELANADLIVALKLVDKILCKFKTLEVNIILRRSYTLLLWIHRAGVINEEADPCCGFIIYSFLNSYHISAKLCKRSRNCLFALVYL